MKKRAFRPSYFMLTDLLLPLSGLLAGCLLTTWFLVGRQKRELARVAAHMTARVRERIEAYIELEAEIRRVIFGIEQSEVSFDEELSERRADALELSQALAEHDGQALPEAEPIMEAGLEARPAVDQGEIERWQERLKNVQAEKQVELDHQAELILHLTDRMQLLEARREEDRVANSKAWFTKQELVERVDGEADAAAMQNTQAFLEVEAERDHAIEEAQSAKRQLRAQSEYLEQRDDRIAELTEELDDLRNNYSSTRRSFDGQKTQIYDLMRELDTARRRALPKEEREPNV